MTKEEFNERWNKFFTAERLKGLLYHKPLGNNERRLDRHNRKANNDYKKNRKRILQRQKDRYILKKILLENDDYKRAMEELARFTPEERKAYDEWEKEHTAC